MLDKTHIHIADAIKNIPKQLWSILIPTTEKGLAQYLINVIAWKKASVDRRKAFRLYVQNQDNLPMAARKWSLRKIRIAVNIIKLKEKRKYKDDDNGGFDNEYE